MELVDTFNVEAPVRTVWAFFEEQPLVVARCIPGIESAEEVGPDQYRLVVKQKVGHISATFDLKATVDDRAPLEVIKLTAVGRSVRGARTDLRARASVHLKPHPTGTHVQIISSVTLSGVAASLGRKVLTKRTAEVTAEFATQLASRIATDPNKAGDPFTPN